MEHVLDRLKHEDMTKYQSIPFWSWNDRLEPEELVRQIRWMQKNGMGGFFMHARSGLKTEYMSEEWMECIEVCAKEAEKLGMNAWAYDENGWPSGFAGGKLLEDEQNRDMYILAETGDFDIKATVSYRLDDKKIVRVTQQDGDGKYLNLYIHVATSTADILNPKVVDKFIALTHGKYQERFGDSFSEKIKGFFTDEPQYHRRYTPYTRMIAQYFEEEYAEDILDSLGLLFVEKEGYRTFRYRYWKGMQSLMLKNFAAKLYGWCEEHGVKLTGHYVEENTMGNQLMCCGGVMPFYEYEHIPGIDWLGKESDNELLPRQVASVAAQLGKKQVLTETFGCCGWDVTPGDLRRIAGFQYVNGVNLMCQHLVPYAEYGSRKRDFPAHYSDINPWVAENFREVNDYFTRLGYLLTEGKETVQVAMLHPIRSAYFGYKRDLQWEGFGVAELDAQLRDACRMLSERNIAYHFLDETLLSKYGFVQENRIGCGTCIYEYLVLPPLLTMDKSTEELLRKYVENGGKILLLGNAPEYLEDQEYHYSYLCSNCTLEEIASAQPYRIQHANTEIYSTMRKAGEQTYLYAMNASSKQSYQQTFLMGEGICSFLKLDLTTLETTRVPLTITLKPGEGAVLFPDTGRIESEEELRSYNLTFENAEVSFEENYLPIDYVRYSLDGEHFSERWPIIALFEKLLRERIEDVVYFKYEFEVREVPQVIYLRAEECHAVHTYLNGVPLIQTIPCDIEKNVIAYDIAPYVREGLNEYVVQVHWHQSEDVYYALFGENVTESMRNCIVYDSELEPVYVAGQFGVYPTKPYIQDEDHAFVQADAFYIGKGPQIVGDIVTDGLPFVRGAVTLKQKVWLDNQNTQLNVEGSYQSATVFINGKQVGKLLFDKELDISDAIRIGENDVEIRFLIGNRNLLGPQHYHGDRYESVTRWSFELNGTWKDDKSNFYHDTYDLLKFYAHS